MLSAVYAKKDDDTDSTGTHTRALIRIWLLQLCSAVAAPIRVVKLPAKTSCKAQTTFYGNIKRHRSNSTLGYDVRF